MVATSKFSLLFWCPLLPPLHPEQSLLKRPLASYKQIEHLLLSCINSTYPWNRGQILHRILGGVLDSNLTIAALLMNGSSNYKNSLTIKNMGLWNYALSCFIGNKILYFRLSINPNNNRPSPITTKKIVLLFTSRKKKIFTTIIRSNVKPIVTIRATFFSVRLETISTTAIIIYCLLSFIFFSKFNIKTLTSQFLG